ncbi:uncharacterized protein LOC106164056 isoform X2 [Lingula anatina]|uniref:Uncharacterized protein LOC106164056 isoform X2 n=1 Tax=Lingula anatina TaxID=7574 RepID=A0A1S3IHE6_LINAN|nr:uncharacterized protein LOC106164056 isoform X2 [Lingula anatina]|eukprot:XP_013397296.1 uncharacterized protein LOC106164056 isoform X2 [Lingula anatina]
MCADKCGYIQWAAVKCKNLRRLSVLGCGIKIEQWAKILISGKDLLDISIPIYQLDDLLIDRLVESSVDNTTDKSLESGFREVKVALQKLQCLRIDIANELCQSLAVDRRLECTWITHCQNLEILTLSVAGYYTLGRLLPDVVLPKLQQFYFCNDYDSLPSCYLQPFCNVVCWPQKASLNALHNEVSHMTYGWFLKNIDLLKMEKMLTYNLFQVSGLTPHFSKCAQSSLKHVGFISCMESAETLMAVCHDIGEKCPMLRSFSLCHSCLKWNGDNTPRKFMKCLSLDKLPYLTTLSLSGVHFDNEPSVCDMLANLKAMRRLSLTACAIQDPCEEPVTRTSYAAPNGFGKRRRLGVQTTERKNSHSQLGATPNNTEVKFKEMVLSCPRMEVFDLVGAPFIPVFNQYFDVLIKDGVYCGQPIGNDVPYLENISGWYYLRQLTLANLPGLRIGHYLHRILSSCPWIEFLSLASLGPSHACTYDKQLAEGLKHCKNLVDFRLEERYCKLGQYIIPALQHCCKLQRLCAITNKTGVEKHLLLNAVKKLPNLSVIQLFVGMTDAACQELQKALIQYYKSSSDCPGFSIVVIQLKSRVGLYDYLDFVRKMPRNHYKEITRFQPRVDQFMSETRV